jgi:integrase
VEEPFVPMESHLADRGNSLLRSASFAPSVSYFRALRRSSASRTPGGAPSGASKGKYKGDMISPATVNKDLRHIRAALRKAHRWGYLPNVPHFDLEKEPEKLPTYVTPDHFAAIYKACKQATRPADLPFSPEDWWKGLLIFAYMTGWRINEILALRRDDLDIEAGTAITRAEDNKSKRDERVKLHPVVVEHLKRLPGFTPVVFPWDRDETCLYNQFRRIQEAAGVKLPCPKQHRLATFPASMTSGARSPR